MFERRSIKLPIVLGVTLIVLLVVLVVGWILLAIFGAMASSDYAPLYWTLLSVGTSLFAVVLVGVVMYLILSIKTINLNKRQSNFVDSVTHELKSPIASLKLYLQTLNQRQVSQEEQEEFCRYMLEDVDRLDQLISHLLEAGIIEKRTPSVEREKFELAELVREVAATVCSRYRVDSKIVELDLERTEVLGMRRDFDMIFRNLIDNAVKYANSEPRVSVKLFVADEKIRARISDNGPGIPKNKRRRVFRRFIRLGSELEREKPGTGLGLYIVNTLVRRLGGQIRIVDSGNGKGTTFDLSLPSKLLATNESEKRSETAGGVKLKETIRKEKTRQPDSEPNTSTPDVEIANQ